MNAGKGIVSTVELIVEVARFCEEVLEINFKKAPVSENPEAVVVVVLDLRDVVVVQAFVRGESAIDAIFEMTQAKPGISDPEASIRCRMEGSDREVLWTVDGRFINELIAIDTEEVAVGRTDPDGAIWALGDRADGNEIDRFFKGEDFTISDSVEMMWVRCGDPEVSIRCRQDGADETRREVFKWSCFPVFDFKKAPFSGAEPDCA